MSKQFAYDVMSASFDVIVTSTVYDHFIAMISKTYIFSNSKVLSYEDDFGAKSYIFRNYLCLCTYVSNFKFLA